MLWELVLGLGYNSEQEQQETVSHRACCLGRICKQPTTLECGGAMKLRRRESSSGLPQRMVSRRAQKHEGGLKLAS